MARTDVDRELLGKLDEVLTPANTDKLLAMVPPDWTQLATKHDLTALGNELRGEMTELRAELRGEMTELRADLKTDMAELRSELKTEMAELRGEFKTDMAELRGDFMITLHKELRKQTYFMTGSLLALVGALLGSRAFS